MQVPVEEALGVAPKQAATIAMAAGRKWRAPADREKARGPAARVLRGRSCAEPGTMAGKAALPETMGEVAYLLDGDSQAVPKFNPWHANADLLNFFIARRMMSAFVHSAADASWSVFLLRGCGGLTPGRANWNMWRAIVGGGTIHARELWRPQHDVHAETLVSRNWTLRRAGIAVLSPDPWHSPLWQLQTSVAQCPHRSSILHDFRAAIVPPLDKLVLNRAAFFRELRAEHPSNVRFLGSPPERSRSLVFLVRRANGVSCPRCLKTPKSSRKPLLHSCPEPPSLPPILGRSVSRSSMLSSERVISSSAPTAPALPTVSASHQLRHSSS